jgi:hypothetical protein
MPKKIRHFLFDKILVCKRSNTEQEIKFGSKLSLASDTHKFETNFFIFFSRDSWNEIKILVDKIKIKITSLFFQLEIK